MSTFCRDWLTTLWLASYKGFPFYYEDAKERGARDIVVHEFPHRDDPYNEDMGQKARYFDGSAYLASDNADKDAVSFVELLCSIGPGTLVDPVRGPVMVRCLDVEREARRDKLGYIAFNVKFVREGAASGLISLLSSGQNVFNQADSLAAVAAAQFPDRLATDNQPQYVVAAVVAEAQVVVATLEVVRTSTTVDPVVSGLVRNANAALIAAAPLLITQDVSAVDPAAVATLVTAVPPIEGSFTDPRSIYAGGLIAAARALADGMAADTACGAMLDVALGLLPVGTAPSYLSPRSQSAGENVLAVADLGRLAALMAWVEAVERRIYTSRPQGVTARAEVAERMGAELQAASLQGAAGVDLFVALGNLRGAAVDYLTRLINDLAPIVTVSAGERMPSLWWGWRLYADPGRGVDLVLRNAVIDPLAMPVSFSALSPGMPAPDGLATAWPAP